MLILAGGRVRTLDSRRPTADAVGIRGGRLAAVGTLGEVRAACPGARELDLAGATLLPGLVDAHGHLQLLGERMRQLDLRDAASAEEIVRRVERAAREVPNGAWIVGAGWDENRFSPPRSPDRALLDARVQRPVFLERVDGHAAWVNRAALERAGAGDAVEDPPGGRYLRRSGGAPTGVVLDAAMERVRACIPPPGRGELEALLRAGAERCAREGLTAVHDAGLDLDVFEALDALGARGELPLRVWGMERFGEPRYEEALASGPRSACGGRLALRAVKMFFDGALGSRGAALFDPYDDDPENRGLLTAPAGARREVERAIDRGFQVAIHALGDRAAAAALDVLEPALAPARARGVRLRLEHAELLRRREIERMAAAGVVASMQPTHATSDMGWIERRVGARRAALASPWRTLLDAGVALAFGSDFPIEDPSPLRGVFAACTRQAADGTPPGGWHPEQRLGRLEALEAFTTGAAWAAMEEGRAGRLAPGLRADLSAFDRDPVEVEAGDLLRTRAVLSVVDGAVTFGG